MKLLALYLDSVSSRLQSISRPGRMKAYSPQRRSTISAIIAMEPKVPDTSSTRNPIDSTTGTAVSSVRTPSREAMRPVRKSCDRMVSDCTTTSMVANTCVRCSRSAKASLTMRSCSK